MRPRVRTILIFLLTIGLLAFFFRKADPAKVWAETRRADPLLLVYAVIVTGLTYAARAWRWQMLLAPIGPTRFTVAFETTVIGFAANALIPGRVGEVLRPYLLARREALNATSAFATIILERVLDLVTVLLLFAVFVFGVGPGVILYPLVTRCSACCPSPTVTGRTPSMSLPRRACSSPSPRA